MCDISGLLDEPDTWGEICDKMLSGLGDLYLLVPREVGSGAVLLSKFRELHGNKTPGDLWTNWVNLQLGLKCKSSDGENDFYLYLTMPDYEQLTYDIGETIRGSMGSVKMARNTQDIIRKVSDIITQSKLDWDGHLRTFV